MEEDKLTWKSWIGSGTFVFVVACLVSVVTSRGEFASCGFVAWFISAVIAAFVWQDEQLKSK